MGKHRLSCIVKPIRGGQWEWEILTLHVSITSRKTFPTEARAKTNMRYHARRHNIMLNQTIPDPTYCNHTECPATYVAWHEWAERKMKTHKQERCHNCGLLAMWIKK